MCALPLVTSWLIWGIKTSSFTYTIWFKSIFLSGLVLSITTIVAWWAFFGFDTGLLGDQPIIQVGIKEGLWNKEIATVWVPAPEWVTGLLIVIEHHKVGALVFVNGQIATLGVPYFYLVTILLKTPIPFLIFMIAGLVGAWKSKTPRHWQARALAALPWLIAVLGLFSTINYGIRHILIVYPIGAVGAACGLIWLIEKYKVRTQQLIAGSLLIGQLVIAGIAYPNYLPYFNILAGDEPGEILNDSDLDWGQGLFELSDYCKENKIDTPLALLSGINEYMLVSRSSTNQSFTQRHSCFRMGSCNGNALPGSISRATVFFNTRMSVYGIYI